MHHQGILDWFSLFEDLISFIGSWRPFLPVILGTVNRWYPNLWFCSSSLEMIQSQQICLLFFSLNFNNVLILFHRLKKVLREQLFCSESLVWLSSPVCPSVCLSVRLSVVSLSICPSKLSVYWRCDARGDTRGVEAARWLMRDCWF